MAILKRTPMKQVLPVSQINFSVAYSDYNVSDCYKYS